MGTGKLIKMRRGIFGASRKEVNGSGETKQWGGY
jgi:hypothetical protein